LVAARTGRTFAIARTLGEAGILRRAIDGFQQVHNIGGSKRVFVNRGGNLRWGADMTPDLVARLRRTMRGEAIAEKGVTGVAGVTGPIGLRLKPQQLRQLRPLRLENGNGEKRVREGISSPVTQPIGADLDAIEERAAIISETCPAPYSDTFARLNHQKPMAVSDVQWSRALDDAGRFLDEWGAEAAAMQWSAGELFDLPREGRPAASFGS
jgi:hypothetical protein